VTELAEGRYRVSSRLPLDELGELFGLKLEDEDVETVGGLMGKVLNKVPIAGSVVRYGGLELVAERSTGRRNRIGTVVVTALQDEGEEGQSPEQDVADDLGAEAATRLASESAIQVS
jgi:CBS domain containing-hemolysin-like protein